MEPELKDMTVSALIYAIAAFAMRPKNNGVSPMQPGQATHEEWQRHHAVCAELDRRFAALEAAKQS
ncbi:MAG: hypothetical protein HOW73_47735 [Polyangiaceae bacterium]|nr:hypothetical protein [Polyangiaceae bacterium]